MKPALKNRDKKRRPKIYKKRGLGCPAAFQNAFQAAPKILRDAEKYPPGASKNLQDLHVHS